MRCELLHAKSGVHTTMVQMPAVKTPQFSWVFSPMQHPAQPVPPIYQPELAARAVLHAADHPRRREYWVGSSTMGTLAANAMPPGWLDRYLGRPGFTSQQTNPPQAVDALVNLWEADDGNAGTDFSARGIITSKSHNQDAQPWASHQHGTLPLRQLPPWQRSAHGWHGGPTHDPRCAPVRDRHGRRGWCGRAGVASTGHPAPHRPSYCAALLDRAIAPRPLPNSGGCHDRPAHPGGMGAASVVDTVHAASMCAVAALQPLYRRGAVVTVVATIGCAAVIAAIAGRR